MRLVHLLPLVACWIGVLWAGWQAPVTYIDLKQYLLKDQYRLVDFEVEGLRAVNSDPYSATALGTVEGRHEEMGLGHFFLGSKCGCAGRWCLCSGGEWPASISRRPREDTSMEQTDER